MDELSNDVLEKINNFLLEQLGPIPAFHKSVQDHLVNAVENAVNLFYETGSDPVDLSSESIEIPYGDMDEFSNEEDIT